MNKYLILLAVIILCSTLNAQTKPSDVLFTDGTGVHNTRILGQYKDLVLLSDTGSYKIADISKIKTIKFDNGNHKWTGAAIGAVTGFLTGVILYSKFTRKGKSFIYSDPAITISIIFTIPAAVIGGLVGSFFKNIDLYDLSEMGTYMKTKEIKWIREHHYSWQ